VQQLAKLANADALLFTSGVDHISTGGRKAQMVLLPLALGILTLPIGGGGAHLGAMPPGSTTLSVALVDGKSGTLLWYNAVGNAIGHALGRQDIYLLTYPDHADELVERAFHAFPVRATPTRNE